MQSKNHMSSTAGKPNALINELSPYLLQHAYNPVNWQAWNEQSLLQAIQEQKPLFISIGYATCHWCHVMEKESFENEEIAQLLNEHFISIKVDREERPDIDAACMEVCQNMTGHGGWPLSMFMTPDKKPFFAGTYFPPVSLPNRIGFKDILLRIIEAWNNEKESILKAGDDIVKAMKDIQYQHSSVLIDPKTLTIAEDQFVKRFDAAYGGFGSAPKFPTPHNSIFLLRRSYTTNNHVLKAMAEKTLIAMAQSGMYDHIGQGFHRYSTDQQWYVPHFEKMLYDQAMLIQAYAEAWLCTGNSIYKNIAERIIMYCQEYLISNNGSFFSGQVADSEGEEGTYYLFTHDELTRILNKEEYDYAEVCFDIDHQGNYHDEFTGEYTGKNILRLKLGIEDIDNELFNSIISKLKHYRSTREAPFLDDKILTDWNSLMIASLSFAGRAFSNSSYIDHAILIEQHIKEHMFNNDSILLHTHRNGISSILGMCEDYAMYAKGLLELFQATGDIKYASDCKTLCDTIIESFIDNDTKKVKQSLIPPTDFHIFASAYDGAIPSGPSFMVDVLGKMGIITENPHYLNTAFDIIHAYGKQIETYPSGFSYMLCGLDFLLSSRQEIVLAGNKDSTLYQTFLQKINSYYMPHAILIQNYHPEELSLLAPSLAIQSTDKDAIVYICKNYSCQQPIESVQDIEQTFAQLYPN